MASDRGLLVEACNFIGRIGLTPAENSPVDLLTMEQQQNRPGPALIPRDALWFHHYYYSCRVPLLG